MESCEEKASDIFGTKAFPMQRPHIAKGRNVQRSTNALPFWKASLAYKIQGHNQILQELSLMPVSGPIETNSKIVAYFYSFSPLCEGLQWVHQKIDQLMMLSKVQELGNIFQIGTSLGGRCNIWVRQESPNFTLHRPTKSARASSPRRSQIVSTAILTICPSRRKKSWLLSTTGQYSTAIRAALEREPVPVSDF